MNKGRQTKGFRECDAAGMVDPYMDEVTEGWRIIMKSFINFTLPSTSNVIKENEVCRAYSMHGQNEMHTKVG
jgi:hypothetical protein